MNQQNKSRREFMIKLGAVMGGCALSTVSPMAINSAFAYQRSTSKKIVSGKLFSLSQMKVLADVCQTIIPKTDTPSALELDCHGFIDHQLMAVHTEQEQQSAISVIDTIDAKSKSKYDLSFYEISPSQQLDLLQTLERDKTIADGFKQLKYLNAFGYFTSDVGAMQVLQYQPVPGGYIGSIPVTDTTTNYGSLAYY